MKNNSAVLTTVQGSVNHPKLNLDTVCKKLKSMLGTSEVQSTMKAANSMALIINNH